MKMRQARWLACGIAALQVLALSQAGAQSIGVNLNANGRGSSVAEASLADTDVAGVVPQAHWANLDHNEGTGFDGTAANFVDSDGTITTVSFEYIANDAWSSNGGTTTPDQKMMKGIQKSNPDGVTFPDANSAMTFRWGNLLPGSTYNVIVYQAHNGGTARSDSSIVGGDGTIYYTEQTAAYGGTWIRSTSTTPGTYMFANYVQFDGVSPDGSGTIEIRVDKHLEDPELADGMGVPGLQLVKVTGEWPQPADPPVITQQPQDILAVVGDKVTVSIGIDGPWNVEWFRNDVSVSSGTATDYVIDPTTAADKDATVYAIVSNVAGSETSDTITITLDDPLPEQLMQGFLRGEHYGGVGGTVVYPDLYEHPPFQSRDFDYEFFTLGGAIPDTGESDFGRVMEGWVVPDVTGSYNFFIRSDDGSELFVNPVGGTSAALPAIPADFLNSVPDAVETGCCNPFQEPGAAQTTGDFTLTAGEFYGIAGLYKEGGGGDYYEVAWRQTSDTTAADQLSPLGPENVYCMASPAGKRATVTEQPQSVTVLQNRTATFTVAAETLPRANEFALQWTKDGVNIPYANQPTFTTGILTLADDGTVYQAKVYTLAGLKLSDEATLTVNPDTIAPDITSVGAYAGDTVVGLIYSEAMEASGVTDPFNYAVDGVTVLTAEVLGNGDDVVALTLDGVPAPGATVTATGVTDLTGNPIAGGTATIENPDLAATVLIRNTAVGAEDPVNEGRSVPLGGGSMFIEAGGGDIWETADGGHGAYGTVTGPFRLQVRVQSLDGPDNWTKAILDVRETTDGNSRHVNLVTTRTDGQNQSSFDRRDTTGGNSGSSGDDGIARVGPIPYPNAWLRIDRLDVNSNTFDGYLSDDGVNWTLHYSYTIPDPVLPETLVVGMAATAHNNDPTASLAEALFRDYSVLPLGVVEDPVITLIGISAGTVSVDWTNGGELETAPAVEGPWTPTGDSSGSYTAPAGGDAQKYYQVNKQP